MRRLLIAFIALLSACQTAPSPPSSETSQPLLERPIPVRPLLDVEAEHRAKAAGATPMAVDLEVDSAVAAAHRPLMAELDQADREELAALPLPVLLPDSSRFIEQAVVTTGERWYAASANLAGHMVLVTGTARGFRLPDGEPRTPRTDGGLRLNRSEGIVSLSFQSYGAGYLILVECAEPLTDVRCTEDAYIIDLAHGLGHVEVAP